MKILVTGATGYIGGRLVPRLLERGYEVRCLTRRPQDLEARGWNVEVVQGDALDPISLARALAGIDAAYYLIHSMAQGGGVDPRRDRRAAARFARAAKDAAVGRVIYLGGLGAGERLSPHLASRQAVGETLRRSGPPLTEFRAAVIVGSGSVSFEMMRYIVDRMPVIPSFSWLRTRCQPIAVRDVLAYLLLALETPESAGRTFEIGGRSVHTYEEMMRLYARRRGLKRLFIAFPNPPPYLSAKWVELASPIPSGYAGPLIDSLQSEVVCRDRAALDVFPIKPLDYETALRYALLRIQERNVETTWSMALAPGQEKLRNMSSQEGLIRERRALAVHAPAQETFAVYCGLGGERGWLYADALWALRGAIDRLLGGVGMRRGRRHPDEIKQGEALDFWRVERVIPGRLLRLRAEMRLPGKAWLQFESAPTGRGCVLTQAAFFEPRGLWGNLYWYLLYPVHRVIFAGLIREVKRRAEAADYWEKSAL